MTPLTTNDAFDLLVTHMQQMGAEIKVSPNEDTLYQEFIQRFPAEQIAKLTLEQYCIGKGDSQSFSWWLERGLEPVLGRYMPGTARGHILYFQPDGVVYKHRNLKDLSDQAALEYTLAVQAAIANVTEDEDWQWIDNRNKIFERAGVTTRVTVGDARKLRLLAVYHPDSALPITSSKHIGHFLEKLGCPKLNIPAENKPVARMFLLREYYLLAKQQLPELTPFGFVQALYSPDLKLAPLKDEPDETDVMDDEAVVAERSMKAAPLNQILYGPPGTGKTYVSIEEAVKAAEPSFVWSNRNDLKVRYDELVTEGRIRFVTFHQSYSYEDFVEGLSASSTDGKISYEKKLGVFRKLVNTAREYRTTEVRKASESFTDCWQAFIKKLDESPSGVPIKTKRSQFVITEVEDNTIRFDKNLGNSVHTLALSTLQAVFEGQREVHGGLQPYYDALIAHIRDLGQQLSATEVVRQNYVLIIDEINRGNISRIFGELITLIEPSKRIGAPEALEVTLPLTGDKFGVPDNIYIIGTMNTADRSLAGLDLALRRRFTFVEMPPKPELLDGLMVEGTDIGKMLRVMNQRITAQLDRDHCIGHAYFMPLLDNPSLSLLADIFSQNILPLLQEYFFEDWLRIRWVLADQAKKDDTLAFVVKDEGIDAQQLFPGETQFKTRDCWRLNADALLQAEAYQQIYQASMTIAAQTH